MFLRAFSPQEGFLNFCLGCFMFKLLQQFGLISKDPSVKCDESKAEIAYAFNVSSYLPPAFLTVAYRHV